MSEPKNAGNTFLPQRVVVDQKEHRKRVLLRILSSPWTLLPFVAGVTTMLGAWAFSDHTGIAMFAGLAGILGAAGMFFTQLFMGGEKLGKEAIEDLRKKALTEHEKELDELDKKLSADGDSRTEGSLRDLRTLVKAFHKNKAWLDTLNTRSSIDILSGVEQLYTRCVLSLEKTIDLYNTADSMSTQEAREPILNQREKIISEVVQSIKQLGKILAGIQSLDSHSQTQSADLSRIRTELDRSLEVAKTVDERMRNLDSELKEMEN